MTTVAVVAHSRKSFGGGLPELREVLAREGFSDPLWYEVNKSRKAPMRARRALSEGAELVFVWGGDGMVQRCVDAVTGTDAALAILPAGTANLLATNLAIPADLTDAVRVGLHGEQRMIDTGTVNGEHFAVMAGAGFDALMISGASRQLKNRLGGLPIYTPERETSTREQGKQPSRLMAAHSSPADSHVCWSVTSVKFSAESRSSAMRGPTTGYSSSAWSPRRIPRNGYAPSHGSPREDRASRVSFGPLAAGGSQCGSIARSLTNSMAVHARQ